MKYWGFRVLNLLRVWDFGFRTSLAYNAWLLLLIGLVALLTSPSRTLAAGISVSGTTSAVTGQTFTVRITAGGAEFDSLQGVISHSGVAEVVRVAAGSATWLPGKSPGIDREFVGITSPTKSLTVATISLRSNKEGRGTISVSKVKLARNGAYVGSDGGSLTYTIGRAPTPPGAVTVTSSTHPDQSQAYEATTLTLNWQAPVNGATGYAYILDQSSETNPESKSLGTDTTKTYENLAIGEHFFHIKAVNNDGWGPVTHFKITIKEPDAKVDETLTKPRITSVEKSSNFTNDVKNGTVKGVTVKGDGALEGYVMILLFDPKDRLPPELFTPIPKPEPTASDQNPENAQNTATATPTPQTEESASQTAISPTPTYKPLEFTPLMATPQTDGSWRITVDSPIPSGFYKLTVQGQKEKTLTPPSDPLRIEVTVAQGGQVRIITDDDANSPTSNAVNVLGVTFKSPVHASIWFGVIGLLFLTAAFCLFFIFKNIRLKIKNQKQPPKSANQIWG